MKNMFVFGMLAAAVSGCATFTTLSPNNAMTDLGKGVWVAKSSSFFGIMTSSQQVLFCRATDPSVPVCSAATGDIDAAKTGGEVK
jgi:hypothetical protein